MGSPSLGAGLPRLSSAKWYPDSAGCVLVWEVGLVDPRFPQLPPLITALLSFCIVFTAVQQLLLSLGTDRLTRNHRAENNTWAKERVHKTWFLLMGRGWGVAGRWKRYKLLTLLLADQIWMFVLRETRSYSELKLFCGSKICEGLGFSNLRSYVPIKITLEMAALCPGQTTKSHLKSQRIHQLGQRAERRRKLNRLKENRS